MIEATSPSDKKSAFQPVRLAAWASLAMLSSVSAYYLYQHPIQITRGETAAAADPAKQAQQVAQQQALSATRDVLAEVRRLSAAVGTLNTDRDRLYGRLSSIEQTIDSITGSLSRLPTKTTGNPLPASPVTEAAPAVPQQEARANPTATSSDTLTTAGSSSTIDPAVQRPIFGVDLGTAPNVEGLRALWRKDVSATGVLAGLQPVVAVRETPGTTGFKLRLIVGPLADAAAAARLCTALTAEAHRQCEPTVYDGQRLAMDVAPPAPAAAPPRKKPTPLRLPSAPKPLADTPQILPR